MRTLVWIGLFSGITLTFVELVNLIEPIQEGVSLMLPWLLSSAVNYILGILFYLGFLAVGYLTKRNFVIYSMYIIFLLPIIFLGVELFGSGPFLAYGLNGLHAMIFIGVLIELLALSLFGVVALNIRSITKIPAIIVALAAIGTGLIELTLLAPIFLGSPFSFGEYGAALAVAPTIGRLILYISGAIVLDRARNLTPTTP